MSGGFPLHDAHMQIQFIYSSFIPAPLEKVWALYADANTINQISPFFARVNFERLDLPLRAGAEIIFIGKFPPRVRWHARLETFVENSHFVDVQLQGPFAFWRHEHIFKSSGAHTAMIDRVTFSHHGGTLRKALLTAATKLLLRTYFAYRHARTRKLLRNQDFTFQNR